MAEQVLDDLERLDAGSYEDAVDVGQIAGDSAMLRDLAYKSPEFFIDLFLHEQLEMPVPGFHKEIWGLLTDLEKERILLAIPRDHAKTTLAKLVVIWYWVFTSHRFCVYLSNTSPIAKGACKDIIEFLHNPNFEALFGKIQMIKHSENEALWVFDLNMPNGKKKRCILRGLGQGQQMRGINIDNQRPDIAVVDDVEDNENTGSIPQQKKLDRWIFGPFLKALARRKKILWLGNMLTKTSLLARLSRKPKWNPVVFGSIVKDVETGRLRPLWPDKWSIEALIEDFIEYRDEGLTETWLCEMMNMPGFGQNGFSAEQIKYAEVMNPDMYQATWITIDPAFGLNAHNDETCISVHGIPKDGSHARTIQIVHGRGDETWMFNETMALAEYWGAYVWGIEAIAAQRLLIPLFTMLLAQRLMHGRVELVPLTAGRGDSKISRIRALVSLMGAGDWAVPDSDVDFTLQLVGINTASKDNEDDIVDSVAYGPIMMNLFLGLILASAEGNDFDSELPAQSGMAVCNV